MCFPRSTQAPILNAHGLRELYSIFPGRAINLRFFRQSSTNPTHLRALPRSTMSNCLVALGVTSSATSFWVGGRHPCPGYLKHFEPWGKTEIATVKVFAWAFLVSSFESDQPPTKCRFCPSGGPLFFGGYPFLVDWENAKGKAVEPFWGVSPKDTTIGQNASRFLWCPT